MNKIHKQVVFNQLMAMRAQVDAMMTLLAEELEQEDSACPHPNNKRKSLSTLGGAEHWLCTECGYEFREDDQ
jgi:rubrerythrin